MVGSNNGLVSAAFPHLSKTKPLCGLPPFSLLTGKWGKIFSFFLLSFSISLFPFKWGTRYDASLRGGRFFIFFNLLIFSIVLPHKTRHFRIFKSTSGDFLVFFCFWFFVPCPLRLAPLFPFSSSCNVLGRSKCWFFILLFGRIILRFFVWVMYTTLELIFHSKPSTDSFRLLLSF